jgi:hypothetical protein
MNITTFDITFGLISVFVTAALAFGALHAILANDLESVD